MAALMYLRHFGLTKNPFLLNTSGDCVYYSAPHCETMAHLLYAVREQNGIVLLMGAAGTGKTTLLHAVLKLLRPAGAVPSVILNPMMETTQELLYSVLAGFNVNVGRLPAMELLEALCRFLESQAGQGRRAILVVDEAQHLNRRVLEDLRLISDLEQNGKSMIQLILSAQPEFRQALSADHHAALRQRIVAHCILNTLQPSEVWNYLALRVSRAGGDGRMIFLPEAVDRLASLSSCTPRLINVLADNSLIAAYARGLATVDEALVSEVARNFELTAEAVAESGPATGGAEAERTPESWKKLVVEQANFELPEALRSFVDSLSFCQPVE
jgi:type II secretory pathway predicted ATPase ExeA